MSIKKAPSLEETQTKKNRPITAIIARQQRLINSQGRPNNKALHVLDAEHTKWEVVA